MIKDPLFIIGSIGMIACLYTWIKFNLSPKMAEPFTLRYLSSISLISGLAILMSIFYNSGDKKKIKFLKSKKVKLINVKLQRNGEFDLRKVMSILYQNNIRFLLVEGGNQLTNKMLNKNLFNEFYLIKTDNKLRQSGKLNIKKIVYKLSKKFKIKSNINQYFDKNRITRFN